MDILISIDRKWFTTNSTIGILTIPQLNYQCYTLENVARPLGVKVFGETCIPTGTYEFKLNVSSRFNQVLPLLYNNKNLCVTDGYGAMWSGVRIHGGNTTEDTSGCILVGYRKGDNKLYECRKAINDIMDILNTVCASPKVKYGIKIENNQSAVDLYQ